MSLPASVKNFVLPSYTTIINSVAPKGRDYFYVIVTYIMLIYIVYTIFGL